MTTKELYKLRAAMTKEMRGELAEKFGFSRGYIDQVLTAHRRNEHVLLDAVELVSQHVQKLKKAEEFISSLDS